MFVFNFPPTAKVIWRRGQGLVSLGRLVKPGIEPAIPGLQGKQFIHNFSLMLELSFLSSSRGSGISDFRTGSWGRMGAFGSTLFSLFSSICFILKAINFLGSLGMEVDEGADNRGDEYGENSSVMRVNDS